MLEAVPNLSEGRDAALLGSLAHAFAARALVLDVHADADHHRAVFTLAAEAEELVDALLGGIALAVETIDLRRHEGVHPRVGVADVVPVAPLVPEGMPRAVSVARSLASRLGAELGLPVFHYGELGEGRRPAFFRRGGLDELRRRVEAGELEPDAGPATIDPRSGVALVGARQPLVAYNVVLATDDVEVAREVARAVRGSSGGMVGVQAIGLLLPQSARVQVSMNIIDVELAPLHEVVERVRQEAAARGVEVATGELVGLVPAHVLDTARAANVVIPGVDASRVLEHVLASRLAE
ncbi:MAG TPA: glutamate formimidoyltransferase [Gaiellaceae bacterium]|nr:glutamate formimidoyltransferase [Gaiellaceae bacterium]